MGNIWKALCLGVVLAGCGPQDDLPAEATRTLQFDTIQVEDGAGVEVIRGGGYGYRIPADLPARIDVSDGVARVRARNGNGTLVADGVRIYVEALSEVRLSGKSKVEMAEVSAERFVARLSGQAELRLAGVAGTLEAHFTGNSELHAAGLEADRAVLRGSGNGWCEVKVAGSVDAHLTGNAHCDVLGTAAHQDVVLEGEAGLTLR